MSTLTHFPLSLPFRPVCTLQPRMYLKFVESIYLECLKERMMSDIKFEAVARCGGERGEIAPQA